MSDVKTVDARGLNCPEPVMLVLRAMQESGKGILEVLVDSGTARENVSRLGKNSGWTVTIDEQPDGSSLIILKK